MKKKEKEKENENENEIKNPVGEKELKHKGEDAEQKSNVENSVESSVVLKKEYKLPAVEINNLVKQFKRITAVDNLSLRIEEGEIFGLIGPNGAGKSTTIKILATLLQPTSGDVKVFGIDVAAKPAEVRKMITYLPEEAGTYKNLSGREYLEFMASFYVSDEKERKKLVEQSIAISGLGSRIDSRTKEYSRGMKRRLLIARSLMTKPKLCILDEPTSGLDITHTYQIRSIIKQYASEFKVTVILSSHNMLEVEYLCDRVALINKGRLVESGTPSELIAKYSKKNLEEVFMAATSQDTLPSLKAIPVHFTQKGTTPNSKTSQSETPEAAIIDNKEKIKRK
ncbi:MAG: ABC transporter ATP-binding protein [Thermoplasmata archaeon]